MKPPLVPSWKKSRIRSARRGEKREPDSAPGPHLESKGMGPPGTLMMSWPRSEKISRGSHVNLRGRWKSGAHGLYRVKSRSDNNDPVDLLFSKKYGDLYLDTDGYAENRSFVMVHRLNVSLNHHPFKQKKGVSHLNDKR